MRRSVGGERRGRPLREVVKERRGHDRHRRMPWPHLQPHALRRQSGGHRVPRAQAQGGSAGQDHRMGLRHRGVRRQRFRLPRARPAAADVTGGHGRRLGQHDGHPGAQRVVLGRADADPRHVADGVRRPRPAVPDHGAAPERPQEGGRAGTAAGRARGGRPPGRSADRRPPERLTPRSPARRPRPPPKAGAARTACLPWSIPPDAARRRRPATARRRWRAPAPRRPASRPP